MAVNHLKDKEQIKRFVAAMLVVCAAICVIAMLQIPAGGRVTAPFEGEVGEPNTLGGYLVLMLSITLGLLVTSDSMKRKTFLGVLVVLIAIPLLATLSRSSWLAMGPMIIMPDVVKDRALFTVAQRKHAGQIEIGGIRLDTSASARVRAWKHILTTEFIKHPVFGRGVAGYGLMDAQYPRVLVETGILGLIAFLSLLFFIYKNALSTYRNSSDPFFSGISLGYIAGFIAMVAHAVGTNTFVIVRIMEPFWFLTAIIIVIPTIEAGKLKTKAESKEQRAESGEHRAKSRGA
jgi:O-antigen ligase